MILTLVNQKGGVGKSTIAMNLAAAAHLDGRRVLLLDLDPQGSCLDWYAKRAEGSPLAGLAVMTIKTAKGVTARKVRELGSGYDVTILDCPARVDRLVLSAAVAADVVVMPVSCSELDLWAADPTLDMLDQADELRDELGWGELRRLFVVSRAKVNTVSVRATREALVEDGRAELLDVVMHEREMFKESVSFGETPLTQPGDEKAAGEATRLYQETFSSMLSSQHASMRASRARTAGGLR